MIDIWVELSQENPALAVAELRGAVKALGGSPSAAGPVLPDEPHVVRVVLPSRSAAADLGRRLALARRVLEPWAERAPDAVAARVAARAAPGRTASVRPLGRPGSRPRTDWMDPIVRAWRDGGGRVDLGHPEVRLFLAEAPEGPIVAEEVHPVDRSAFSARRMPRLPFRRPVSLPPKLGRVAVNLAAVRPGDRVADPFLGTGALALEAGILGARVTGVDQDESMVKGALQNFAHLGLQFEGLRVGDAEREASNVEGPFDALVTDPPYGRSSGSGGEAPTTLVARVLPAWAERVRPDGRIVVVLPGGPDPLGPPWRRAESVADRVHRSLTREFRVYARGPPQ